jgi:hypothetical protein
MRNLIDIASKIALCAVFVFIVGCLFVASFNQGRSRKEAIKTNVADESYAIGWRDGSNAATLGKPHTPSPYMPTQP